MLPYRARARARNRNRRRRRLSFFFFLLSSFHIIRAPGDLCELCVMLSFI
jgi:hypothetical protein